MDKALMIKLEELVKSWSPEECVRFLNDHKKLQEATLDSLMRVFNDCTTVDEFKEHACASYILFRNKI